MKIGILGTGRMASALGTQWAHKGHTVYFGSREPARAKALAARVQLNTSGGSIAEASAFSNVILLATIWKGVKSILEAAGNLEDKILIDCTLPLVDQQIAIDGNTSGSAEIGKLAPGARVVKAFHTIPYEHFSNPTFSGSSESMFYCGDDLDSKQIVKQLAVEMNLDPVDCGPLFLARYLEGMALVWIFLAAGMGQGNSIGFKLLRR